VNDKSRSSDMIKTSYKNISGNLIVFSVLLLVFLYDVFNPLLGFFDEFLALIAFLVILKNIFLKPKIKLYREEIYISFFLIALLILGLTSNFITSKNGFVTAKAAIFGDMVSFFKAYLVYFGIRLSATTIDSKKVVNQITFYSERIFYILLVFVFIDFIFNLYPQYSRFGIHSFQLFFTHTSRYGFAFVFIFLALFPKFYNKRNLLLLFVLLIGVLSLRVKYFGFFIFSILFLYNTQILKRVSKRMFIALVVTFIIVLGVIFREQISMYFNPYQLKDGWSRAVLLYNSFNIGNDFFPFGTGFGTYASHFSGKYYSWVYELYHIDNVFGISRQYWEFISDQFWPMVLGQFGYFGLLSYLGIIYAFFTLFLRQIKNKFNTTNYRYVPLLGLILLLIDSSSDAIFTQNRAVAIFIIFALFTNIQRNITNQDEKY